MIILIGYLMMCGWGFIGGFDWVIDALECFSRKTEYVFLDDIFIWEPNYNSYHEWVESMLLQDPTYDIDVDLTRLKYVDGKYPRWNEIEDDNAFNYIQAELFGYEDTYN